MIEQLTAIVPYGPTILAKAEETVAYSKETAIQTYKKTSQKVQQSKDRYNQFTKDAKKCFNNIVDETADEFLGRVEKVLGVQKKCSDTQRQKIRMRIQAIYQTILRDYILKYSELARDKTMEMIELGKKYSIQYTMPIYIHVKAVMLVSRQMFLEFLQNHLDDVKMTYQSSKDMVTMFVNGKFNEENIKTKFMEGIDNFKQFTVEVVNKGLKIKIDRKTLIENYDRFAVQFLEVAKQMREKSENNIGTIKKKSRDLYKEVVQRIKEKELQIRCEMREIENTQDQPTLTQNQQY